MENGKKDGGRGVRTFVEIGGMNDNGCEGHRGPVPRCAVRGWIPWLIWEDDLEAL